MSKNLKYTGPHEAAEVSVDDGRYALVLRDDLTDEQAATLGYELDGDAAVISGKSHAVRVITVSDELAAKLDGAGYDDPETGEFVASWQPAGGKVDEQTVDVPESNPSTMPVTLESGEVITSTEADKRAYDAAAAEDEAELAAIENAEAAKVEEPSPEAQRIAAIDERLAQIDTELDAPDLTDESFKKLSDEAEELNAEKSRMEGGN